MLRESLLEQYDQQVYMCNLHKVLRKRKKKKDELITAYILKMKYIACRAGLLSIEVQMRVMLSVTMPLNDFLKMIDKHNP